MDCWNSQKYGQLSGGLMRNNRSAFTHVSSSAKLENKMGMAFFDDNVLVDDPDPQSMASLVLLKRGLWNRRGTHWLHKASRKAKRKYMQECFQKDRVICYKCKATLTQPSQENQHGLNVASVDHIVPVRQNPELFRDPDNFRIACQRCNSSRH